ncbi:MAG: hypothetical protein JNJ55_07070 [Betaproteobacteria bacterium]|nr:hypothetical protein [Betaproteobacteria bacterium]
MVLAMFVHAAFAGDSHVKGDHHSPKYGGVVREAGVVQYELVAKPDAIALFIEDHGKKVDVSGASAKLTLLNGKEKSEVVLTPAGGNKLEAKGSFRVSGGTRVVAVVTLAGKPALSMRFVVPK